MKGKDGNDTNMGKDQGNTTTTSSTNTNNRVFTIPSFQSAINKNKNTSINSVPLLFQERLEKQKSNKTSNKNPASGSVPNGLNHFGKVNNNNSNRQDYNANVPPPIRVRSSDGKAMVEGGVGPPIRYQPGSTPIENIMGSHIGVNKRQQGNPILKHIKHAPTTFIDMVPDYLLGPYTCALFISIRYHLLFPNYLIRRIRELKSDFRLRIILCLVDVDDSETPLMEINKLGITHECTLLLAWSVEEAARYLETFKVYEKKGPASIMERIDTDIVSRTSEILTTIRSVNKTDVKTLISTFGSMRSIVNTPLEKLKECPGLGDKKVKRLYEAFHNSFYSNKRSRGSNEDKTEKLNKSRIRHEEVEKTGEDDERVSNYHTEREESDRIETYDGNLLELLDQEEEIEKEERENSKLNNNTGSLTETNNFVSTVKGSKAKTNSTLDLHSQDYSSDDDFIDENILLELDKIEGENNI